MLTGVQSSGLRRHPRHVDGEARSGVHFNHGIADAAPSKTTQKAIFAAGVDLDSLLALKPSHALGHRPDGSPLNSVECHATLRTLLGIVLDLLVAHQVGVAMGFLKFIIGQDALALPLDSQVDWGAEGLLPSAVDFGRHEQESLLDLLQGVYTTLMETSTSEVCKEQGSTTKFKISSRAAESDNQGGDSSCPLNGILPKQSVVAKEEEEEDTKPPPGMMALLQKRRHTMGIQALGNDLLSKEFLAMSNQHEENLKKEKHKRPKRKSITKVGGSDSASGSFSIEEARSNFAGVNPSFPERSAGRASTEDSGSPLPAICKSFSERPKGCALEKEQSRRRSGQRQRFELPEKSDQSEFSSSLRKAEEELSSPKSGAEGTPFPAGEGEPSSPNYLSKCECEAQSPTLSNSRKVSSNGVSSRPSKNSEPIASSPTAIVASDSSLHTIRTHECQAEDEGRRHADTSETTQAVFEAASREDVMTASSLANATEEQPGTQTSAPAFDQPWTSASAAAATLAALAAAPLEASAASTDNAGSATAAVSSDQQPPSHNGEKKSDLEVHFGEGSAGIAVHHHSEGTQASSSGLTCTTDSSESENDDGAEVFSGSEMGFAKALSNRNGLLGGDLNHIDIERFQPSDQFRHPHEPQPQHKSEGTIATGFISEPEGKRSVHAKTSGILKRSSTGVLGEMVKQTTKMWDRNLEEDRAHFLGTPSHRFIIHPSSTYRMTWDALCLIIIMMEAIILPLGLCFDMYPHAAVMWLSTTVFTPDIMLNFFTGFYHNGVIIMRQTIIIQRYTLSWFWLDFLSTMPWEVMFEGSDVAESSGLLRFAKLGKLMRILRLLRVLKLRGMMQRVEEMFSSYIVLFLLSIMKTIMFFILIIHWIACLWGWIGNYEGEKAPNDPTKCEPDGPCEGSIGINGDPWRQRYGLNGSSRGYQYLTSLQFATGLLTGAELPMSAGYWAERMFVILMMIFGFLMCSTIISTIVVIMDRINQGNQEYLEETRAIRDFMVARGMPLKLQTKVKRYLEYQFKSRKVVHQNHEVMLKLSPFLRLELTEHMNRSVLEHHPFFAGMEPALFSEACCLGQSVLYAPGDVVAHKGRKSSSIVFLVRGQLEIQEVRNHFSVFVKPPAWIGDRGLFVTSVRHHNVVCSMHSELLTIRQHDLLELVNLFPSCEGYIENYCKRILEEDPTVIFCEYCRDTGHELTTCEALSQLAQDTVLYKSDADHNRGFLKMPKLNNLLAFSPLSKNGGPTLSDITGSTSAGAAAKALPSKPGGKLPGLRRCESNISKSAGGKYDAWQGEF